jgi:tRNA pseudouridine32 synthase/23S rRNA pseudouridine746 synthase
MPALSAVPDLSVIHVDDHLVVVDKPAGLLSVPGRGPEKADCVSSRVQDRYPDALVVHRLDQATSGLLVLARGAEAQKRLSQAFAGREVLKRYLAWVQGCLPVDAPSGVDWHVIDLPLAADWPRRPLQIVHPEGRPSLTRWRCLQAREAPLACSLLELEPHTGRSHQLRVHLQAIGHPIWGDTLYGWPQELSSRLSQRLQLHAQRLELPHPVHGERMAFQAPLPQGWGPDRPEEAPVSVV